MVFGWFRNRAKSITLAAFLLANAGMFSTAANAQTVYNTNTFTGRYLHSEQLSQIPGQYLLMKLQSPLEREKFMEAYRKQNPSEMYRNFTSAQQKTLAYCANLSEALKDMKSNEVILRIVPKGEGVVVGIIDCQKGEESFSVKEYAIDHKVLLKAIQELQKQ